MTMTLVSTVTVGSGGAASIDFTGIAATATDLLLVISARSTHSGDDDVIIKFNASSSNYVTRYLRGSGSGVQTSSFSTASTRAGTMQSSGTSNTFTNSSTYITNYSGSIAKAISTNAVSENNATGAWQFINAALWNDTSAITSIAVTPAQASTFVQYTTASLYTITKGSGGATVS